MKNTISTIDTIANTMKNGWEIETVSQNEWKASNGATVVEIVKYLMNEMYVAQWNGKRLSAESMEDLLEKIKSLLPTSSSTTAKEEKATPEKNVAVVNGVVVNGGVLPKVGGGWGRAVGSDWYGGEIAEVAPDKTWFKTTKGGYAKLDTRKNSCHYGDYVFAVPDGNGKLILEKTSHCRGCKDMNRAYVLENPSHNELDPSF